MGREIDRQGFAEADFRRFGERLHTETEWLRDWEANGALSSRHGMAGYELEAWLVDEHQQPSPASEGFLAAMTEGTATPELSRYNFELNAEPLPLGPGALERLHVELANSWRASRRAAASQGVAPVMIGTLPTVTDAMLGPDSMSPWARFHALNEQILAHRRGRPLALDIQGWEFLHTEHSDVMTEAAATSFQVHLQIAANRAVRYFNAALVLAAPLLGPAVNAPFLFGRRLWQESRIPLFEQSVASGGFGGAAFGPIQRAGFGSGYARRGLAELFVDNRDHYPVLLPLELDEAPESLPHLRLHNGTIWRWVRPLVGSDPDGTPHLRLEHRILPAGPSPADAAANAALFYGLVRVLAEDSHPPENDLEHATARDNFYRAAKHGPEARITWRDGRQWRLARLLTERLLPAAAEGLRDWGCRSAEVEHYLGIISERLRTGQTGAAWQIGFAEASGRDFPALVAAYRRGQDADHPVHEWPASGWPTEES
jgi:gamma-glutamyl:cysteine ligase YbdK (ATP-grasp superfamily)